MGRLRVACVVLVPLLLVACGEPTLKSEDFDGSARRLAKSVDEGQRLALEDALDLVRRASAGKVAGTEAFSVDGMTASDVLAEARRIDLRQEKAEIESEIAARRALFSEAERLAGLGGSSVAVDGRGYLTLTVRNSFDEPLDTGSVRTSVELPNGRVFSNEDFVSFGRSLQPGEERPVQVQVTGEVRKLLPAPPDYKVTAVFTMVANHQALVAKKPNAAEIARAKAAIEAAERELSDVDRRLREAG